MPSLTIDIRKFDSSELSSPTCLLYSAFSLVFFFFWGYYFWGGDSVTLTRHSESFCKCRALQLLIAFLLLALWLSCSAVRVPLQLVTRTLLWSWPAVSVLEKPHQVTSRSVFDTGSEQLRLCLALGASWMSKWPVMSYVAFFSKEAGFSPALLCTVGSFIYQQTMSSGLGRTRTVARCF